MYRAAATSKAPTNEAAIDWTAVRREALERVLRRHFEGEIRFDRASRMLYSTDASHYQIEPIGVVIPRTQADLAAAVAIAMEQRVPIIPRGGGTSLSGQSIGAGLIIDFRKYLHQILETNVEQGWVRVEPGVVLAELNRHLAPLGFQFGPDVATIDRANLGGMIGNNSAGARSIWYGKTVDHVVSLNVLLTDGRAATLGPRNELELSALVKRSDREGEIYRTVTGVMAAHHVQIARRFPKILRRVSGYNLDILLPPEPFNLAKLIVGSEGTLATVTSAQLKIVPLPKHRGLAVAHFDTLEDSLAALSAILSTKPSAVELIDQMILDLARRSVEYRDRIEFVQGQPAAILLIEYSADSSEEVDASFRRLRRSLAGCRVGAILQTQEPTERERIWSVRKTAMPLLFSLPGSRKPVTFVEDTAVDPARLPEFVARFKGILRKHGTDGSFYGHASVGCLHIRPLLDLASTQGRRDMVSIANEVADLVLEFGGAMSGEHGDGLARSVFNPKLFGDEIYHAFRAIKQAFDPDNLMNPGKIVDGPPITDNLRELSRSDAQLDTLYSFEQDGGIAKVAERCNGNGLCRREGAGTMCPSYMVTRAEEHSPRGRANLLRAAFEGRLAPDSPAPWAKPGLDAALDLCLMCKACKTECPSSVDVAKMKSEYLYQSYRRRRPSLLARLMADIPTAARWGSRLAPFSNWTLRSWPARWIMSRLLGIDMRRKLPAYQRNTLTRWFGRRQSLVRHPRGKVVLLADCFTNHHEPSIGRDAVTLLELSGYQVILAPICCGRVLISKGFLDEARDMVRQNSERLLPYLEDGLSIVGTEPSCLLTLTDEWRDLIPGADTELIAHRAHLVETWLAARKADGASDLPDPIDETLDVLLHGHCHQKAAGELKGSAAALRSLAGVAPKVLDSGCCGMAGSFGYEQSHYELSVAIAEQRLLPALRQSPGASVVAPGFSCRTQIADLLGRRALHPVELIRQRLAETSTTDGAPN